MSNIAQTILSQIKKKDQWFLPAIGAKNFATVNKSFGKDIDGIPWNDGVQFDVKGTKFKGRVIIMLNSNDLYDIILGSLSGINMKKGATSPFMVRRKYTDISVENLVSVLDASIG